MRAEPRPGGDISFMGALKYVLNISQEGPGAALCIRKYTAHNPTNDARLLRLINSKFVLFFFSSGYNKYIFTTSNSLRHCNQELFTTRSNIC